MKNMLRSLLGGVLFALVLLAAFLLWSNHYRASVEQQAYDLMTATSQAVLGSGDWTLMMENMDPSMPIQSQDMASLRDFGRLVELGEVEGVAIVPSPLSGEEGSARLRITGHFTNGGCITEALLVHRDGQWLFTHFTYIPGSFAQ